MNHLERVIAAAKMEMQNGGGEHTFSPSWHDNQNGREQTFSQSWHADNRKTPDILETANDDTGQSISMRIRNVLDSNTGDVRMVNDDGTPLPEGVTFLD